MLRNVELTNQTIKYKGITLYRIRATKNLPQHKVKKGQMGGWVQSRDNLLQEAWVFPGGRVYGKARVAGNAVVHTGGEVFGNARVFGNAQVGNHSVRGEKQRAKVYGYAKVSGNSKIVGGEIDGHTEVVDSTVSENSRIGDLAVVKRSEISGSAQILDMAKVSDSKVSDSAIVGENSKVYGSEISGHAHIGGFMEIRSYEIGGDARIEQPSDLIVINKICGSQFALYCYKTENGHRITFYGWKGVIEDFPDLERIVGHHVACKELYKPELELVHDLLQVRISHWESSN